VQIIIIIIVYLFIDCKTYNTLQHCVKCTIHYVQMNNDTGQMYIYLQWTQGPFLRSRSVVSDRRHHYYDVTPRCYVATPLQIS